MTDTDRTAIELAWVAPHTAPSDAWPGPTTERWQPLRLGLVDLFYYDDEQFWFHDGRLLLRGNNGTGKSKVLALTLPFLLDGSVLARRVEPDADPKKRMEWNLLLGGAHPSSERTGYAWVEFGRVDADGNEHFTTLGIGLKAATGRGIVKTWYFISPRRIGELRLVDDNRVALTQERLRDELASTGSGQVYTTQETYRRAVDEALFRLGEERYAALVDLLIQLRQPQLSKKPDEKSLSAALTEALAPLDQAVVADVAESFRSLEEERSGIAEAKDTLRAAQDFLQHYRAYAKVAARRHTTVVREANSSYEWAGRNLREAETDLEAVTSELDGLAVTMDEAEQRRGELEGRDQALRASPEMRDADQLDRSAREAAEAEHRSGSAEVEAERARISAERDTEAEAEAVRRRNSTADDLRLRDAEAQRLAVPAGLADEHVDLVAEEEIARRVLARRRDQVTHVRRLAEAARQSRERAEQHRVALDRTEAESAGRAEDVQAVETQVETAVVAHRDGVRGFAAGLRILTVSTDSEELATHAEQWARSQAGGSPARVALEAAVGAAQHRIGRERAAADQVRQQVDDELTDVNAEITGLEAGHDPEPPASPGRDPRARAGLDGAPLWRLTDFSEQVPDADRAGLEAALQSAGLLDAWVFPDGTLQTGGDVVLGPQGSAVASSLATVLVPAVGPGGGVPVEFVAAVLSRVGLGESSGAALWVDGAGQWGAGPARGSWSKQRAEHVGAGAREISRRHRLAELRIALDELEVRRVAGQQRITEIDELAAQVRAESDRYPGETESLLVRVHTDATAARRELARAQETVHEARERWHETDQQSGVAATELADEAGQLRLGTTLPDLDAANEAVTAYAQALSEVRNAARTLSGIEVAHAQAATRAAEAGEMLRRRDAESRELRTQASSVRARFEQLQATVGATVAQLQVQLSEVAGALKRIAGEFERIRAQQLDAAGRQGNLERMITDLAQRREETAAGRDKEVAALRTFASTGLLRVALPELESPDSDAVEEWNVTAALALSRSTEQQLDGIDESDESWLRSQQRVSSALTELASQMSRHGHTAFVEQHGDVIVARVRYLSEEVDVDRLADRLDEDVADRERLLSAREREILENHLVNEVAGHLHELLLSAEGQIDRINRELAERRTSTGMQLRVRWRERADGPAGLAATRDLMLRSDATWAASDRAAIGDFLQAQIADARQADPTGGWQEHLEQALDYRQWHSFTVERLQNGQWRSASGPASGGEKVLAVSVPLFAAASAHYNSAGPLAPRLILLDEAFAGVDDDSRAKSLGLLATFDLDVVMTSEREWGCYPQVPGLSIAQLSRVEGVDAVGVTRWRWDGSRRQRVGEIDEAARAAGGSTHPGDDPSLFE